MTWPMSFPRLCKPSVVFLEQAGLAECREEEIRQRTITGKAAVAVGEVGKRAGAVVFQSGKSMRHVGLEALAHEWKLERPLVVGTRVDGGEHFRGCGGGWPVLLLQKGVRVLFDGEAELFG